MTRIHLEKDDATDVKSSICVCMDVRAGMSCKSMALIVYVVFATYFG